jgi:hypothetical protein
MDPISEYYDVCFGLKKSKAACDAFASLSLANATCADCIMTLDTDAAYGPLIRRGGFVQANVAGCIELTDSTALVCAKSVAALSECELAACEANCPVSDGPSFDAYTSCAQQSDATGCKAYVGTPGCADAGGASACLGTSFEQFYFMAVPLFCAAGPDAAIGLGGADAGASDSTQSSGSGYDASAPVDAAADGFAPAADAARASPGVDASIPPTNGDAAGGPG